MSSYKTAESVSPKHPDKLCDQISDAVLDAYLTKDSKARVAVEAIGGHGRGVELVNQSRRDSVFHRHLVYLARALAVARWD